MSYNVHKISPNQTQGGGGGADKGGLRATRDMDQRMATLRGTEDTLSGCGWLVHTWVDFGFEAHLLDERHVVWLNGFWLRGTSFGWKAGESFGWEAHTWMGLVGRHIPEWVWLGDTYIWTGFGWEAHTWMGLVGRHIPEWGLAGRHTHEWVWLGGTYLNGVWLGGIHMNGFGWEAHTWMGFGWEAHTWMGLVGRHIPEWGLAGRHTHE